MYKAKSMIIYYCVTPVHMGAGTGLGLVDNPIQREKHTNHPLFPGSGIKGAIKDSWIDPDKDFEKFAFGSDSSPNDQTEGASALCFTDATLVAFPARSIKNTFIYLCSPMTLARLHRQIYFVNNKSLFKIPSPPEKNCALVSDEQAYSAIDDRKVVAENFEFNAELNDNLKGVADLISKAITDEANNYFSNKIKQCLVMLNDADFNYFVNNCTSVEAHVQIDDETGLVKDGALFYVESLPPETLLSGIVLSSEPRTTDEEKRKKYDADEMLKKIKEELNKKTVQFGGNATTGRGLVNLYFYEFNEEGS
jgi:CRISPR-associated protein Cmr4